MGNAVSKIFDREAARYDGWFESRRGRALFQSEVRCLQGVSAGLPRPWLEVGVGTGRFAEALGIEVGVDPARGALEYAARRGIRALPGVGQALPFDDGEFGTVFVIVTICFADDPVGLLSEARRAVMPRGGIVLGIVPAGSPWARFYVKKGRAGHTFYSQARFYTLMELEHLLKSASLRIERAASTLFQNPSDEPLEVESPHEGATEGAGFVAVLCRPQVRADRGVDVGRSTEDSSANEAEPLICMKDDVEIDRGSPHCPYPSSQCRFREWCLVRETVRAKEEGRR